MLNYFSIRPESFAIHAVIANIFCRFQFVHLLKYIPLAPFLSDIQVLNLLLLLMLLQFFWFFLVVLFLLILFA